MDLFLFFYCGGPFLTALHKTVVVSHVYDQLFISSYTVSRSDGGSTSERRDCLRDVDARPALSAAV